MSFPNINWEQLQKIIHLDDYNIELILKKNWIIAFSGGADSVLSLVILLSLQKYHPVKNRKLILYFLDHGEQSREVSLDRKKILEFYINAARDNFPDLQIIPEYFSRDMKYISRKLKKNFEFVSSRLRRKHLEVLFRKNPDSTIVMGHNMSDWFETIILRLNRGSINSNLFPFLPFEKINFLPFFRPLVFLSHREVRQICVKMRLDWWDDPSNFDESNERSRMRASTSILNEDGFRISAHNMIEEKIQLMEKNQNISDQVSNNIKEISPGREYRITLSEFNKLNEIEKNILLDHILTKLHCWPISGRLRKAAQIGSLSYKNLKIHTENWNQIIYIVFRKGRNFSIKPGHDTYLENSESSIIYGHQLTKKHFILQSYGKKSVKKIFSEFRLSSRQRQCCVVRINNKNPMEILSIYLSAFGMKDLHRIHLKH